MEKVILLIVLLAMVAIGYGLYKVISKPSSKSKGEGVATPPKKDKDPIGNEETVN
jgi:hypothetical protein